MESVLCPSCGKVNNTAPCQRCGCDLAPLFAIDLAAQARLASAAASLRDGEALAAHEHAGQSWELRHSSEAARVAFLACVAMEEFDAALLWRRRAMRSS